MKIKNQLISSRKQAYKGTSKCRTITIHETANTAAGAGAQAHANLQSGGNSRSASWHIQVDDKEAIRSFPNEVRCWHAGAKAKDSIAIEICVNSDSDYDQAFKNAAAVVRKLLKQEGLESRNIVGHTYWTGKNCPARMLGDGRWDEFIALVENGEDEPKKESAAASGGGSEKLKKDSKNKPLPAGKAPWPKAYLTVKGKHNRYTHKAWVKLLTDVGHKGASRDLTRAMQNWLSKLKDADGDPFYEGYIDSKFGPMTTKALQRFLASKGLYKGRIDGKRGKLTVRAEIEYLNLNAEYYFD